MIVIGKFLCADLVKQDRPKKKTNTYNIWNDTHVYLGMVKWYAPWRRYCFFPADSLIFEEVCLRDIANFCEQQTKAHKAQKTAE